MPSNQVRCPMQGAVQSRSIRCVAHFTRLCNLPRILSEGLKSRAALEQEGGFSSFSDSLRMDEHAEAICLSISFPNYKMFFKLRSENPQDRWVVLALQPSVLWEKDCAFFKTNAANNCCRLLDVNTRKNVSSFSELFEEQNKEFRNSDGEEHSENVRSYFELPPRYTTDPQAEVLCFDPISIHYIMSITFKTEADMKSIEVPAHISCRVDDFPFLPRKDYVAWQ